MSEVKFILVNLTAFRSADVIAFQERLEYDAFVSYARMLNLSFIELTEEDAAKLLIEGDGIGCGCYTMYDVPEHDRLYRRALARCRMIDVASFTGFIMMNDPVEARLVCSIETNEEFPRSKEVFRPVGFESRSALI